MHLVKTGFKWYLVLLIKHMFRPLLTGPMGHMQQWDPDRRIYVWINYVPSHLFQVTLKLEIDWLHMVNR